MKKEEISQKLSYKIGLRDINQICVFIRENPEKMNWIWDMAQSSERRISVNALWVISHLSPDLKDSVCSLREKEMIEMLLTTTDNSKKRILLQLLRNRDYTRKEIPTDLLDFCLSKINAECETYATRAFSVHIAFKMCRYFPELLEELNAHLELLSLQNLSPGLKSALRQTTKKIARLR